MKVLVSLGKRLVARQVTVSPAEVSRRGTILSLFAVAIRVLESNLQLASKEASLSGANVILSVIEAGGFGKFTFLDPYCHGGRGRFRLFFPPEFNVKEMRPPGMDTSGKTKYPVLFKVYGNPPDGLGSRAHIRHMFSRSIFTSSGAPTSQMVTNRYQRGWDDYVVGHMRYVVVVVDGRGSNYKGRKLRNPVRGRLGYWEPLDQVSAARYESLVSSRGVFSSELPSHAHRHILCFLFRRRRRHPLSLLQNLGEEALRGSETYRNLGVGAFESRFHLHRQHVYLGR